MLTCGQIGRGGGFPQVLWARGIRVVWGLGRLRRTLEWLRRKLESHALILLYHRIGELCPDIFRLSVTPPHFAQHLEVLRKWGRLLSLVGLASHLKDARVPNATVVLTFDDGYADNLYSAKPLLERYDVPATVFVVAGYVGGEREFWWDELERLLLHPGSRPDVLSLDIGGKSYRWELGEAPCDGPTGSAGQRDRDVFQARDAGERARVCVQLWELLRGLPDEGRRKVLDEIGAWAGLEAKARESHRVLRPAEVVRLNEGGLVEVGAHTLTHTVLSSIPAADQRADIEGSKARLEGIVGHPVTSFSYPYGTLADYTAETVALVRQAGFECACANSPGTVMRGADALQLPRVVVRDWDGDEFARRLNRWFGRGGRYMGH